VLDVLDPQHALWMIIASFWLIVVQIAIVQVTEFVDLPLVVQAVEQTQLENVLLHAVFNQKIVNFN